MRLILTILSLMFASSAFAHVVLRTSSQSLSNTPDARWSSPHFEIHYKKGETHLREAKIVAQKAEQFLERLETYLDRRLERKIVISLEGDRGSDPNHRWAYVDTDLGWMHLFRFPEDSYPYQTGLSHELVHAFRFEHLTENGMPPSPAFVFLEEGLAEYLSNQIEPDKAVFANYGFAPTVVAGQWVDQDEDIPLTTLLNEQFRLRRTCIAQAYTLQPSFFRFVESERGRETIRRLAYAQDIDDEESFTPYLGGSFSTFVSRWRHSLLNQFNNIPDHDDLGRQWRTQTPIADMYVCKKGVDF